MLNLFVCFRFVVVVFLCVCVCGWVGGWVGGCVCVCAVFWPGIE